MNLLTRIIPFAGAFLLAGAMVACGDDGGGNNPIDAGEDDIDANVVDGGAADACVGGHGEGCVESPFALPEHGEFRLELFQTGPSGEGDESRLAAQAFFFTGQDPLSRPIGGMPIVIRKELADQGYACVDMSAGTWFDNGGTPEAQNAANSREYIDVGETATLTNVEDEDEVITLNKFESADDPALATDISANLVHDILYQAPEDTEASLGTQWKPGVMGSLAYAGLDLGFGEAALFGDLEFDANGEGDPVIYMPSNFQITSPAEEDYYDEAGLTFTKGQDFTITYEIDEPEDVRAGGHPTIIPFIGFIKNREVQAYCLRVHPAMLDSETFIIPYEVFEIVDQDPPANEEGSYFEFGRFTHSAWEVQNLTDPHRLDLLGVNCQLSPDWQILDAPAP